MLFNRDSAIQSASRRFCTITSQKNSVPCQSSERSVIPSRRPTIQSIICPDLPLHREASNCSNLHPSGRFNSTSERLSVFDKLQDFFRKHSYGKIAATVRTTWIPFRTRSSIRQVPHSKSRRLDASQHGPDARALDMEIACIKSTVQTIIPLVRTREALVWKLFAAEVRPSGRQDTTIWTRLKTGKNFSEIFRKSIAQLFVRTPYDYHPDGA
jgi:hypothetical protein